MHPNQAKTPYINHHPTSNGAKANNSPHNSILSRTRIHLFSRVFSFLLCGQVVVPFIKQPSPGRDSHSMCSLRRCMRSLVLQSDAVTLIQNIFSRGGNIPHTPPAEPEITPQVTAPVIGTLEMKLSSLNEPINFEFYAGVDQVVKVPARVF